MWYLYTLTQLNTWGCALGIIQVWSISREIIIRGGGVSFCDLTHRCMIFKQNCQLHCCRWLSFVMLAGKGACKLTIVHFYFHLLYCAKITSLIVIVTLRADDAPFKRLEKVWTDCILDFAPLYLTTKQREDGQKQVNTVVWWWMTVSLVYKYVLKCGYMLLRIYMLDRLVCFVG